MVMRLPRVRFSVRSIMVAVAVLAVALVVAPQMKCGVDLWRRHLNDQMKWSRSPIGEFFMDGPPYHQATSLLKVSEIGAPDPKGFYCDRRWCLGRRGELTRCHLSKDFYAARRAGSSRRLTAAELAQVQEMISNLPPSNRAYSRGDLVLVSFLRKGSWFTRVYDKATLPSAVQDLVAVFRLKFDESPGMSASIQQGPR